MGDWLIYGANGYTGELIARAAVAQGLTPVLAGRGAGTIASLAQELGLAVRAFALTTDSAVDQGLAGVDLVLNCAGPFVETAAPMLAGCLRAGAHYLDITGEIDVFEHVFAMAQQLRQRGIIACPGVGFDVIPTDCVAMTLAAQLPTATQLSLGFDTESRMSRGTLRTSLAGSGSGRVRSDGAIVEVPLGSLIRTIDFGAGPKVATAIGWGDVATAYHSTGISNIDVYIPIPTRPATTSAQTAPAGPTAQERASTPSYVWGEVTDPAGNRVVARLKTANGYDLTISGALAAVTALLPATAGEPGAARHPSLAAGLGLGASPGASLGAGPGVIPGVSATAGDSGPSVMAGAFTPAQLFGADLVCRLPGSTAISITHT